VGIGMPSAMVLEEEAFHRTFPNRRHVAAYAGLTPTPFQSGNSSREQGITKAGNPRLRRLMIELAWLWLRYQPDSPLTKWFQARVGDLRGRIRRSAITAVARKLLILLWRYVTTGQVPDGTRLSPA
jgi:transposase